MACVPFKEVFRLELLKSCSQVLPRDHSRAQNIVFFFVCSNPRTTVTPIPYSQINCKAGSPWCSASRSSEIRIPTVNSVLPFYHCLLIEPQRPFQPARGSTHKAYVLCGHAWQGRTRASQILCFVKTRLSSLKDLASQAQARAVREASENSEAPGARRN